MEITQQQHKAAQEVFELIAKELGENRAVHSATAISSCARLSGSFLFRSFDLHLKNASPGNAVLSEEANEKGPALVNFTGGMLSNFGVDVNPEAVNRSSIAESKLGLLDTLNLLQSKAAVIMTQNDLSFEQMAYSCAIATAFLIKECSNDIVPASGFHTAIYHFIEGSKTYPPELSGAVTKRKGIFSFWK